MVWDMVCLWIGLVVGVLMYYMVGSLVEMGMLWLEGVFIVFVGNVVVFVLLVFSGYLGMKFGVFFLVLVCVVFGIWGVNVLFLLCVFVVCGWFGI